MLNLQTEWKNFERIHIRLVHEIRPKRTFTAKARKVSFGMAFGFAKALGE